MIDPLHHLQNSSIRPGVVILVTTVVQAWHLVSIGAKDPQNRPGPVLSITVDPSSQTQWPFENRVM